MGDAAHVKGRLQHVPVRALVGGHDRARRDPGACELDAFGLAQEGPRQGAAAALTQRHDDAAPAAAVGEQTPIDAPLAQVGRPDMSAERRPVDLNFAAERRVAGLGKATSASRAAFRYIPSSLPTFPCRSRPDGEVADMA
jgi:hypothetical protein